MAKREYMDDQAKEFFQQILRSKTLPKKLVDTYKSFKFANDRLGGGAIGSAQLVNIALIAGCDIPEPGAAMGEKPATDPPPTPPKK